MLYPDVDDVKRDPESSGHDARSGTAGDEVADHGGGDLRRIRTDPVPTDRVIGGEQDCRSRPHAWKLVTLDRSKLDRKVFEPT